MSSEDRPSQWLLVVEDVGCVRLLKDNRAFLCLKGALAVLYDTDTVLITLNHLFNETNALYSKIASDLDLPESSFYILYTLLDMPEGCSQRDLCAALCLTKSTINSAVKVILQRGFVSLQRAPDSKRKKTVCLSEMGADFMVHNILPLRKAERNACLRLRYNERGNLLKMSQKYIENLQTELLKASQIKEGKTYENNHDQP